jgi:hypothetical protein
MIAAAGAPELPVFPRAFVAGSNNLAAAVLREAIGDKTAQVFKK